MFLKRLIKSNNEENYFVGNADLEKIKSLLDTNIEIEKILLEELDFGSNFDKSKVIGSDELISEVLSFEKQFIKTDIDLELKSVKFVDISDDENDVVEKIKSPILGIESRKDKFEKMRAFYNVKTDYMNLLELKSFYDGIAGINKYDDDVLEKLKSSFENVFLENHRILGELADKSCKYRTIQYEDKKYVRAMVSKGYKNYNNRVSVFLTLYIMEEISRITEKTYKVNNLYITDSDIKIEFSVLEKQKEINGDIEKGFLGIDLKNNELAQGAVSLSISYYIKIKGKLIRLNPQKDEATVSNPLLAINHILNPETVIDKLKFNLEKFKQFEKQLLEMNEKVHKNKLTDQFVFEVIKNLSNSQKIEEHNKEKIKMLKTQVENLLDFANLYDKLEELNMEFDEKSYVSYVLFKAINDWKI